MLGGGATDGKGVSLVYYFALPEEFELGDVENKEALSLMQRFIHDSKEKNGWISMRIKNDPMSQMPACPIPSARFLKTICYCWRLRHSTFLSEERWHIILTLPCLLVTNSLNSFSYTKADDTSMSLGSGSKQGAGKGKGREESKRWKSA